MPKITFTDFEDQVRIIDAVVGDSVMETAVRNGVPGIVGECGDQAAVDQAARIGVRGPHLQCEEIALVRAAGG